MITEVVPNNPLRILLVEDDPESLDGFRDTLPTTLQGRSIEWVFSSTFEDALGRLSREQFDIVATDIYRDRTGVAKSNLDERDIMARDILNRIRGHSLTPVVAFSDSSLPNGIVTGPFLRWADKAGGNTELEAQIAELIATGVPDARRAMHAELDQIGGVYLWSFLENEWNDLTPGGPPAPEDILRIVRRRAATAFGKLSATAPGAERVEVHPVDYYVYPRIGALDLRLGDIAIDPDGRVGVVVTPHCHLATQINHEAPRISSALVVWATPANDLLAGEKWGKADSRPALLGRRVQSPADQLGSPPGRYWFLPPFVRIPASYCDFVSVTAVPLASFANDGDHGLLATLDAPFAEAFQSSFLRFYSAVGLPVLSISSISNLIPDA